MAHGNGVRALRLLDSEQTNKANNCSRVFGKVFGKVFGEQKRTHPFKGVRCSPLPIAVRGNQSGELHAQEVAARGPTSRLPFPTERLHGALK
jgi:hypothetical protein